MPDGTVVVWGARTAAADPDWKYVAVRRLFLFLEQSIETGMGWVHDQPNDERLWEHVCSDIALFLTRLWREGAFPGERPQLAFGVRCDRATMTEQDIVSGRLVCLVSVAPIPGPGEFITLPIVLRDRVGGQPG